jgi:hypothetical protein
MNLTRYGEKRRETDAFFDLKRTSYDIIRIKKPMDPGPFSLEVFACVEDYTAANNYNRISDKVTAMSALIKKVPYAEDSREDVSRSNLNRSTAKTLWSFPKKKRFPDPKPVCPYSAYPYELSTISKRKTGFGSSQRRVFTEVNEGASSWNYNPARPEGYRPETSFGISREVLPSPHRLASQVPTSPSPPIKYSCHKQNPGPGNYNEQGQPKKRGFSMRPKTAYEKTCPYFPMQTSSTTRSREKCPVPSSTTSTPVVTAWPQFPSSAQSPWVPRCSPETIDSKTHHVSLSLRSHHAQSQRIPAQQIRH